MAHEFGPGEYRMRNGGEAVVYEVLSESIYGRMREGGNWCSVSWHKDGTWLFGRQDARDILSPAHPVVVSDEAVAAFDTAMIGKEIGFRRWMMHWPAPSHPPTREGRAMGDRPTPAQTVILALQAEIAARDQEHGASIRYYVEEAKRRDADLAAAQERIAALTVRGALADIAAERRRQVEAEGWTPEHDDRHDRGEMARAAICYADPLNEGRDHPPAKWPWDAGWWKPKDRRRDLVRAAALLIAEIERSDRAALTTGARKDG